MPFIHVLWHSQRNSHKVSLRIGMFYFYSPQVRSTIFLHLLGNVFLRVMVFFYCNKKCMLRLLARNMSCQINLNFSASFYHLTIFVTSNGKNTLILQQKINKISNVILYIYISRYFYNNYYNIKILILGVRLFVRNNTNIFRQIGHCLFFLCISLKLSHKTFYCLFVGD